MCLFPKIVKVFRKVGDSYSIPAPCGRCPECLSQARKEWFIRNKIELQNSKNCFFITLTYNEDNLPTSKVNGKPCFSKRHIQLFLKRLRKCLNSTELKYFIASEYGGKFGRPHYHGLIYNFPYEKITFIDSILDKTWSYGFVSVSHVSDRRISYVCKYMLQKCQRRKDFSDPDFAPFYLASRRPAIGASYLTSSNILYHLANKQSSIDFQGRKYSLPRYYKRKIFADYPDIQDEMRNDYLEQLDKQMTQNLSTDEKTFKYYQNRRQSIANALLRYKKYSKQKFENEALPKWIDSQIINQTN